jgi:hypothetical protein
VNEISYDGLVVAAQVIAMALYRFWGAQKDIVEEDVAVLTWDQSVWSHLTEEIADSAYSKVRPCVLKCLMPVFACSCPFTRFIHFL